MRSGSTLVAIGLVMSSPPAGAGSAGEKAGQTVRASAQEMFALSDRLIGRGKTRQAEQILALLSRDPSRDVRNEARYRRSQLAEKAGATRSAATLLRHILDEQPDAPAVRLKLASLLHTLGDEQAALRELRAVRSVDLPPAVARFVDRLSASLQASKPFGAQLEFGLAPDSNINRATTSDTLGTVIGDFTLDEDARRKSGVGVALRGAAHRRVALHDNLNLVARGSADLNLYRDKSFNDMSADLSVGPEFRLGATRLTAEFGAGQRWYGMAPYQRQLRISGTASRAIGGVAQGRVDASRRWSNNLVNDLQDGHGMTLRARYERAMSPRLFLSASIAHDRFKALDDGYSTRFRSVGVNAYRDIGRTAVSLGVEFGRLKGDARLDLLPEARKDEMLRLSVGAVFRQFTIAGFAPTTRITVERNRSNIAFYDYKRTRTEVGVSRPF